jgi:hypothetical protein
MNIVKAERNTNKEYPPLDIESIRFSSSLVYVSEYMLNNGNMTQYDRFHLFFNEVNHNLADARPGFTMFNRSR